MTAPNNQRQSNKNNQLNLKGGVRDGKKKSGVIAEVWHNYENSTLFETGKYFTFSGKQNCKPKEFKKPEQKAPLTYWLQTGDGPRQ